MAKSTAAEGLERHTEFSSGKKELYLTSKATSVTKCNASEELKYIEFGG